MKTVLTIAGFDPSSGAGITADLMVFAAHGLFGTSCITALTVQSTTGVREVHPVPAQTIGKTLACLGEDIPPAGIKIGMLGTSDNVQVVSDYIEGVRKHGTLVERSVPVVVDPVIRSSSGAVFLDGPGVKMLQDRLLGLVDWITPNIGELAVLSGRAVDGPGDVPVACRALQKQLGTTGRGYSVGIFAKGGHLEKPDDFLLTQSGEELWISGERVDTSSTHGTGCALSSAFLSCLVMGYEAQEAARFSKQYVTGALRHAVAIGRGSGPLMHLWPLMKVTDTQ